MGMSNLHLELVGCALRACRICTSAPWREGGVTIGGMCGALFHPGGWNKG